MEIWHLEIVGRGSMKQPDPARMVYIFTLSRIGSMYQSESCTSSVSWCKLTAVYMVKRRSTCSTSAIQSSMSRHGVISDLLVGDCWTYRTRGGVHFPAGFLCGWSVGVAFVAGLPERPGSQQRHFLQAPKDDMFAVYYDTYSALEVLRRCALKIYVYLLAYLLTYGTYRFVVPNVIVCPVKDQCCAPSIIRFEYSCW